MIQFKEFLLARSKGHIVNFGWLWSKERKLQAEIDPNVEVKHHVIVLFLLFKQLRMRAKQGNKRKHKKEYEPLFKKWHATYREKCIRTGADNPSYDSKWGCFKPIEMIRVHFRLLCMGRRHTNIFQQKRGHHTTHGFRNQDQD